MSEEQRNLQFVFADLTGDELAICRAALHAILRGEVVDRGGLVAATGFTSNKVSALLEGLSKRGLVVVEPNSGRVVGSWGLSHTPTEHRLNIRGRELHAWCALDAVGIPAGLGEDATIASRCHRCGARLNVAMVDGYVSHVEPTDARLLMVAGRAGRSVVGFTWPVINFFCSVEHLEAWQEEHPEVGGDAVTLVEAAGIGRQNWERARET